MKRGAKTSFHVAASKLHPGSFITVTIISIIISIMVA
jgi:hypothetical protein